MKQIVNEDLLPLTVKPTPTVLSPWIRAVFEPKMHDLKTL